MQRALEGGGFNIEADGRSRVEAHRCRNVFGMTYTILIFAVTGRARFSAEPLQERLISFPLFNHHHQPHTTSECLAQPSPAPAVDSTWAAAAAPPPPHPSALLLSPAPTLPHTRPGCEGTCCSPSAADAPSEAGADCSSMSCDADAALTIECSPALAHPTETPPHPLPPGRYA